MQPVAGAQATAVIDLFLAGGPVMYPLLLCSLIAVAMIIEQAVTWMRLRRGRRYDLLTELLLDPLKPIAEETRRELSRDVVARVMLVGLSLPWRRPPSRCSCQRTRQPR